MWKKRLENQIKDLFQDLDHAIELSKGNKLTKTPLSSSTKKILP